MWQFMSVVKKELKIPNISSKRLKEHDTQENVEEWIEASPDAWKGGINFSYGLARWSLPSFFGVA